eukprot:CAMPEP_0170482026 /NCGR_PEP_ID=MMETSP0208-20121228/2231_1 /TAXON_ID=197538 /ORGANISM="Strombidium inclinatum, Strain S3" /LENGTH=144 /DNA_ID=CAMNT_0010754821 /DNA_START=216 /DNA_END=650 /DNA_ORIENTATION=+
MGHPELRSVLDLELVVVAAAAVAATVLRELPEVGLPLAEAAVAVAAAVHLNLQVGSLLLAESVALANESIHQMIVGGLRVSLGHEVGIALLSLLDGDGNVSILLLNVFDVGEIDSRKHVVLELEEGLVAHEVLIELAGRSHSEE